MPLSDRFMELFAYVTRFRKTVQVEQPPFEEVRREVARLLTGGDERGGDVSDEDCRQARFAVCAWVDEMLAGSPWEQRELWLRDQLQRIHFNTTRAGEEFFDRLTALDPQQREVREVYYLCLALGFTGRFCNRGDEFHLEQLKESNLKLLEGGRGNPLQGESLYENDAARRGVSDGAPASRRRWPALSLWSAAGALTPLLLLVILFFIYRFTLSGVGRHFLDTVAN